MGTVEQNSLVNDSARANDEAELIRKTQGGDTNAFGVIYDHYVRQLYTFVFYKTHHKETAEDITSGVFFKALRSIQSVDPDRPFGPWLYRIARNAVIDHYRTKHQHADIDDEWDIGDENVDVVAESDTGISFAHVKKYLNVLSNDQRDILVLRIWQEKSYKEISEIVGKSEGNCKVIFSRALDKLREVMPPLLYAAFISKLMS